MGREICGASILLAGATGGIGREIGRRLAAEGAELTLFGRDRGRLEALDLSGQLIIGELSDGAACQAAVQSAVCRHGRLDGVINAVGVVAFGEVEGLGDETLDELISTNLVGPIRLMRAALPEVEAGGFIANLSAVVAERPTAGMAAYSATKAALTAFDRALARELRSRLVDVIDVRPPHTETGLADRPIAGGASRLPKGRKPADVADRIVEAIRSRERELETSDF